MNPIILLLLVILFVLVMAICIMGREAKKKERMIHILRGLNDRLTNDNLYLRSDAEKEKRRKKELLDQYKERNPGQCNHTFDHWEDHCTQCGISRVNYELSRRHA